MKLLVAALGAALVATVAPAAPAPAVEPARILIVGDSVTHGYDGNHTWRYFAWQSLQQSGAAVDFVGPWQGTSSYERGLFGGGYADPAFDQDHAARWGMALWEMENDPGATTPTIGALVAAHQPDIVVEQLGVNDFDRMGLTAGQMVEQVRAFVAEARGAKPDVDVVLGSLPQTWIREVGAYNALLPELAAELSSDASRVVGTPVAAFTEGVDTYDFAHPTTVGQEKLAAAVLVGLERVGVVGSEPAPALDAPVATLEAGVAPTVAPPVVLVTPRRVRAKRTERRTVVSWRAAAGAARYQVRCGVKVARTAGRKVVLRSGSKKCKVRAVTRGSESRWVVVRVRSRR